MIPVNPNFMPTLSVPVRLCHELEDYDVDDKVAGSLNYEVVGKDEYGVKLKIKYVGLNAKLRRS